MVFPGVPGENYRKLRKQWNNGFWGSIFCGFHQNAEVNLYRTSDLLSTQTLSCVGEFFCRNVGSLQSGTPAWFIVMWVFVDTSRVGCICNQLATGSKTLYCANWLVNGWLIGELFCKVGEIWFFLSLLKSWTSNFLQSFWAEPCIRILDKPCVDGYILYTKYHTVYRTYLEL